MKKFRRAYDRFTYDYPLTTSFIYGMILILIIAIVAVLITPIHDKTRTPEQKAQIAQAEETSNHYRQLITERFGEEANGYMSVFVDQTNGVTYIKYDRYHEFGMTALLEADGKPHIDEDWLRQHSDSTNN